MKEARILPDLLRGLAGLPRLPLRPEARGEPVLVLPGFGTGDRATAWLRRYLRRLGYRVSGWKLGRNDGDVPRLLPLLLTRLERLAERSGQPVRLVGWSLGGYLARELARERPDLVDQVVTMGTPVVGGPRYTIFAGLFERNGLDFSEIEAFLEERNRTPIRVPVTAIYSRSDGIVSWRACIDSSDTPVEHVEVETSHVGMLMSPEVFKTVAKRLQGAHEVRPPAASRERSTEG